MEVTGKVYRPFIHILRVSLVAQAVKYLPAIQGPRFDPWVGKMPWGKEWQPTPVFLLGETHGQRSLEGYKPQHSDMTE